MTPLLLPPKRMLQDVMMSPAAASFARPAMKANGRRLGLLALSLAAFFLATQTLLHSLLLEAGSELPQQQQQGAFDTSNINNNNNNRGLLASPSVKTRRSPSSSNATSQRSQFERQYLSTDWSRTQNAVAQLRVPTPATHLSLAVYDVHNCPDDPPVGYPHSFLLVDQLLKDWSVDDTDIPRTIYQSVCMFDWETRADAALRYRNAEVPFIVQNHPEILQASERWNSPGYMNSLIGTEAVRTEYSQNNHLMFWRKPQGGRKAPKGWVPPEVEVTMTYDEFLKRASILDQVPAAERPAKEHWYFRLNANKNGPHTYLYDELPIFVANNQSSFFMVRPEQERGINCRLGMRGNIAEMHFDPMRNFVVVMGGQRRYVVASPNQCVNAELHPYGHPSCRHSKMNFSNPPGPEYRGPFRSLLASEIVMQAGDALYIPDSWLHFIVALSPLSFQCNARSGLDENPQLAKLVRDCGFPMYAFPQTARYFPHVYGVAYEKK